jgi:acetoacetyl-CoA synthetase
MWTHGDLVEFDPDGSARLHGRSDGVLNVDGLRIGPGEVYTALRGVPEVTDAMAVEQRDPARPGSTRMVLLVVLRPGTGFDDDLARRIRRTLRREASPAHVPAVVAAVPALPVTHNGKRSERAARDALNGDPVVNAEALRDPACLDAIRAAVRVPEAPAPAAAPAPAPAAGAPDSAVLRDLGRLWRDVLGGTEARPADDFFDLGGSSRQVMSLLRRVALDLGVDVPVQDFLVEPTLEGLADAVVRARSSGTPEVPLLRPGHGRPLFVLGDAWGQLNSYAALVQHLDTERPVYGVTVPLTHEGRRRTITEVAAESVARLREVQSSGPYSLLGYSFGGIVAYETATALRAAGEPVSYLGLIDVLPPLAALTPAEARARRWAGRLETVLSGEARAAVTRRLHVPAHQDSATAEDDFFRGSYEEANRWRPAPYAGPVTYYLAEGRPPFVGNSLAAWRRVAPHLLVTEVPGHHGDHDDTRPSVLSAQYTGTLAARVSASLH